MKSEQHFEIREQTLGHPPFVELAMWYGTGNKISIGIEIEKLPELRNLINEYLGENCDCDGEIR